MKSRNLVLTFGLLACSLLGLVSCNNNEQEVIEDIEVVDCLNRTVKVKKNNERILCIGASALRLYSYCGDLEKLCGVESYEIESPKLPVRPYSYAYKDYFKTLPSIKTGGPMTPADPEAILSAKPDLIFSLYNDVEKMNNLQSKIDVPVVCLSYGKSDPFSDDVYKSLDLIGQLSGTKERSDKVVSYIKGLKEDLNNRTKDIKEEDKKSVFLAYNTYNGGKGQIGSTLVNYTCFKETNSKNVVSGLDFGTNNPDLDLEKIIELAPEVVFMDVMNYSNLVADYTSEKKESLNQIPAFKNNEVYVQMPFNQYYTNIDIAICDSYFVGKTLYADAFKDVNVEEKYNEILSTLLNKEMDYYSRTIEDTKMGFTKLDLTTIK